jgi:pyruvate dehydrogenase E2 component (dihydrolipoamide acetyltransferase)
MTAGDPPNGGAGGFRVAAWPRVDFAAFGKIESVPLTRVQKLAADYLHRNWVSIPHVFHQDEADITALEALRQDYATQYPDAKITTLAFIVRAAALTLRQHPSFNASLDMPSGALIQKHYAHIGIAMDTPAGLVVPVIRDADLRPVEDISTEILRLSKKAREKGLSLPEMSGGCFSVSSLGRMGGTSFTPIINAPEVAILGVSRVLDRPTKEPATGGLCWRSMLPLCLSYDHRANNGVAAARFITGLKAWLEDPSSITAPDPVRR